MMTNDRYTALSFLLLSIGKKKNPRAALEIN